MSYHGAVPNPALEGYNIITKLWRHFWNEEKGTFVCPSPRCSGTYGSENKFVVWSVAIATQAIIDGARLYPAELGPLIDPCIEVLKRYQSTTLRGYCATENFDGNQDIYYDDDGQVASCFISAYAVTQNPKYLDLSRELVCYLMGGWNGDPDSCVKGGVFWHRSKDFISAISNSTVALACLRIAKYIPNECEIYINFAAKCIDWQLENLRDDSDGLIMDGISRNDTGNPDGMKWTYNTGTTLNACVLLYELTGEQKWLQLSHDFAAAALDRGRSLFCRDYGDYELRYWRDPSYFIQLLFEGLAEYLMICGNSVPESIRAAIETEFKRHLQYFRKYHYDPTDGLYFMMFEAHRISEEIWELYKTQFDDSKAFDPNPEERSQEGSGELKDKPLVKTLIGSGAAARIWLQAARVLPELEGVNWY